MTDLPFPLAELSEAHQRSVRLLIPDIGSHVPVSLVRALAEVDEAVAYFKGLKAGDTFRFIDTDGGLHLARLLRIDRLGERRARRVDGTKGRDLYGDEFKLEYRHIPDRGRRETLDPAFEPVVVEKTAADDPDFVVRWHVHVDNDGWEHAESVLNLLGFGVTLRRKEWGDPAKGTHGHNFEVVIDSGRNIRPKSFRDRDEARQWATDALYAVALEKGLVAEGAGGRRDAAPTAPASRSLAVAQLEGVALAYWAARARNVGAKEGVRLFVDGGKLFQSREGDPPIPHPYRPDRDWAEGGPIVQEEGIALHPLQVAEGFHWLAKYPGQPFQQQGGRTPLEAAMRAVVASVFGDFVPHAGARAQVLAEIDDAPAPPGLGAM